jgi:hypothetical protein
VSRWALLVVVAVVLYLPFYVGFASQAGGILPNLIFVTKAQQLLVMFAPLLLPIVGWLVLDMPQDDSRLNWRRGLLAGLGAVFGLFMASFFLGGILLSAPGIQVLATEFIEPYSIREAIGLVLRRRLLEPGTALLLGGLITMVVALGFRNPLRGSSSRRPSKRMASQPASLS